MAGNNKLSRVKDTVNDVLGKISAVQTILNNYPVLDDGTVQIPLTSVDLLIELLSFFGVTEQDIIKWLSDIMTAGANAADKTSDSKASKGVLAAIEHSVKALLLANMKSLFNCTIDPIIPDKLFSEGINVSMESIDIYSFLSNNPNDDIGSLFYAQEKDAFVSRDQWKSKDFNAFLWYLFGPGLGDKNGCVWDNRNNSDKDVVTYYGNDPSRINREKLDANGTCTDEQYKGFKQYMTCAGSYGSIRGKMLGIKLNPYRYTRVVKVTNDDGTETNIMGLNKTIAEFNYDYIYSLKLFDPKVLVASIVNTLANFTLRQDTTLSLSPEKQIIRGKVEVIINKMVKGADIEIEDDYFTFSNIELDELIKKAELRHGGEYEFYEGQTTSLSDSDVESILKSINSIGDSSATKIEQRDAIEGAIQSIVGTISGPSSEETNINASLKFTYANNVVDQFIYELVTQMIMQVLTPKVAVLYAVNAAVMNGGVLDKDYFTEGWEKLGDSMSNLIYKLVTQIYSIIIKELYEYLIRQIRPIIEKYMLEITKERIMRHREMLLMLLSLFTGPASMLKSLYGLFRSSRRKYEYITVDEVDYADIIGEEINENPENIK